MVANCGEIKLALAAESIIANSGLSFISILMVKVLMEVVSSRAENVAVSCSRPAARFPKLADNGGGNGKHLGSAYSAAACLKNAHGRWSQYVKVAAMWFDWLKVQLVVARWCWWGRRG